MWLSFKYSALKLYNLSLIFKFNIYTFTFIDSQTNSPDYHFIDGKDMKLRINLPFVENFQQCELSISKVMKYFFLLRLKLF